jgi:hypothetical protein
LEDVFFLDENNGWTVGRIWPTQVDSCIILRTSDGGKTWQKQYSESSAHLTSVFFTDLNNGTAVGHSGTILQTTNGGQNWTGGSNGSTEGYHDVYFTDVNNGWVVGWNGVLLHTTNGGSDWTYQSIGTSNHLYGISFFDSNNGIIVGSKSIILRTTNGGATFVQQDNYSTFPQNFFLSQNYPNPFNSSTTISFDLPFQSFVTLKVFDIIGNEVAVIFSDEMQAGNHTCKLNSDDLNSGIYFYRLQAGSFSETKKLVILK